VPTTPDTADWTVVARPVEASGVQQPGLIVTGPAVNENIGTVLVEYSTSGSGPWLQAYSGPPTIASVEINGLIGGTDYYVGITYWSVRGVPSAQLVKGPYTAPGMVSAASWTTTVTNRPTELTDGRITTALNASGVLQTAIPSALADTSNILRRTGGGLFTGALAATQNTGALADLNTVGAAQIDAGAVTNAKLGTDAITTLKVSAGAITPVYAALTTGTVNWTASAAEKDLQTVASVVVTRGKVIIRASFTCDLNPQGSASVVGILRLYRGGSEIFDAQTTQQPVATLASSSNYVFSKQWVLDFIDDPGAGTYTYKIAFDPGHTADGDIRRRFLSVTPMEG
jgi:hypothetical protein